MAKKTWNERLNDSKDMPCVKEIEDVSCTFAQRFGPKMLIAPPLAYNEIMKKVPRGKLITTERMRDYLAKKHNADWTCGLTGGIFVNTCAHAAIERGDKTFPYWRTLKSKGELCEKFPDGIEGHKLLLEVEGHKVIRKGKRCFVEGYEERLYNLCDLDKLE